MTDDRLSIRPFPGQAPEESGGMLKDWLKQADARMDLNKPDTIRG